MTLANAVTLFRLALVIPTLYFLLNDQRELTLIILGIVLLGDMVDGALARLRHEETEFGKILDPLVDKIVFASIITVLVIVGQLSWIALAGLLFYQTGIIIGAILWLRKRKDTPPVRLLGKIASFVLSLTVLAAIIKLPNAESAVYVAVVFMYAAGFDYLFNLIRVSREEIPKTEHQTKVQIHPEEGR
jgi:phosphatidylglycerophosphate synthase